MYKNKEKIDLYLHCIFKVMEGEEMAKVKRLEMPSAISHDMFVQDINQSDVI